VVINNHTEAPVRRRLSVFAVLLAGSAGLTGLAPPTAVAATTVVGGHRHAAHR
jgi:hypothetical protein